MSLPMQRSRSLDGEDAVATERCVVKLCFLILAVVPPRQPVLSAVPAITERSHIYAHTFSTRTHCYGTPFKYLTYIYVVQTDAPQQLC